MDYVLSTDFVSKTIREIESVENQDRKREAFKSYEIYEGLLSKYVAKRLAEMYPETYQFYTIADYSLLKKIVDKKGKSYKEKPIRRITGNDKDTAEYEALAKRSKLNRQLANVDKYYNQFKHCALAIFPDKMKEVGIEKEVKLKFIPMAPYEYDVIKDADGCPKVYALSYPNLDVTRSTASSDGVNQTIAEPTSEDAGGEVRSYVFWTDKEHRVFKAKGQGDKFTIWEETIPNNPNGINPYGKLPIIEIPKTYSTDYPITSPLARQTVELNALLSIYLQSGSMQVGQLILKYPSNQPIEVVHQGIFTGMKLPQDTAADAPETDAKYISPNPNLAGHKDSIFTFLNLILDEQGISVSSGVKTNGTENFTSALDRIVANADVQNIIEDNQEIYSDLEAEIFEVVKAIYAVAGSYKFGADADLNVTFVKPKMLVTDGEMLDNLKKMKDLGIFSDAQVLQTYNPNLSEDEAQAMIDDIRADKFGIMDNVATDGADNDANTKVSVDLNADPMANASTMKADNAN